jgi:hypothetical protein
MEVTKIHLSPAEKEMVSDAGIILTKNTILQKVKVLLETVQQEIFSESKFLESSLFSVPPKISKGENYEGLPYAILDYPRIAMNEDLCFIRSMFWWGNFFSSTLHVTGKFKNSLEENSDRIIQLSGTGHYYLGINSDPWVHHFRPDNYRPLREIPPQDLHERIQTMPFIKIAAKFPLDEWESAATELIISWRKLAALVSKPVK